MVENTGRKSIVSKVLFIDSGINILEKHIKPALGDVKLQKVTPASLQSYYTSKQEEKDDKGELVASSEFIGNAYKDSGYVVMNEYGVEIHPGYLSSLFGKFVKQNGLPHITLHGLRHTIASIGNEAGLTKFEISKILGHSSPDVTGRVYMHMFDDTHIESMDRIGDKFK